MAKKLEILCRPLEAWPREFTPAAQRKAKPFKTNFEDGRRQLVYELRKLDASVVVVQVALREQDISTLSGWPRGDRSPAHPGVIVAADTRHGALKWVCDDCQRWTDNVHAIGLTLERLRLADLYGVTRRGEQYAGWKMLPGPITAAAAAATMSIDEAARWVAAKSGGDGAAFIAASDLLSSRLAWESANRAIVMRLHPDRHGGRATDDWSKFQQAAQLLNGLHSRR